MGLFLAGVVVGILAAVAVAIGVAVRLFLSAFGRWDPIN